MPVIVIAAAARRSSHTPHTAGTEHQSDDSGCVNRARFFWWPYAHAFRPKRRKIRLGPYFYNAIAAGRQAISVSPRVWCVRTSQYHDRISHGILMFARRERAPQIKEHRMCVCVFIVYAFICLSIMPVCIILYRNLCTAYYEKKNHRHGWRVG